MILWIVPGRGEISIPANAAGLAVIARTVAASPQKKKTPVKEIPPQKEYDGLSADWDASSPHINPPFSEPSLSAQFQQMAMTTDARAFPSGRAVLSWLSDDSDVEVSSGDEVD